MNDSSHILSILSLFILPAISVSGHDWTSSRPDGHAPIGVMGDHTHSQGEWMASYRYMYMSMDGMMHGTSDVTSSEVFAANYTVTPESMSMEMHMAGVMYAVTDNLTLMGMLPYSKMEMDHRIFPGAAPLIGLNGGSDTFTTRSSGVGDFKLNGLYQFFSREHRTAHAGLGLSIPTGSIGEQDTVPGPGGRIDRQLPAPMQPGSGTWDILASATYLEQYQRWSYGAQASGILRTGRNHHDYRLGHRFEATGWGAFNVLDWLSLSGRLAYSWQDEMSGQQSDLLLNPPFAPARRTVTTAFSENYGSQSLSVGGGVNVYLPDGWGKGLRIAVEATTPVWEDLNGYQLSTDLSLITGIQYAW